MVISFDKSAFSPSPELFEGFPIVEFIQSNRLKIAKGLPSFLLIKPECGLRTEPVFLDLSHPLLDTIVRIILRIPSKKHLIFDMKSNTRHDF